MRCYTFNNMGYHRFLLEFDKSFIAKIESSTLSACENKAAQIFSVDKRHFSIHATYLTALGHLMCLFKLKQTAVLMIITDYNRLLALNSLI